MPPRCFVEPMDCIHLNRPSTFRMLQKRAPGEDAPPATSSGPDQTVIIASAAAGALLLLVSLIAFYVCMKRRRTSRRIGQLQRFLPTFMDKDKTESYFRSLSSSTLVAPPPVSEKDSHKDQNSSSSPALPSNVHHRARSAPVAYAQGVKDHRNRQLERDGSLGQFQQISLISEETILEKDPHSIPQPESPSRTSLSNLILNRSRSISVPATAIAQQAPVVSSLHRSVSLNKHSKGGLESRSPPLEAPVLEEDLHLLDRTGHRGNITPLVGTFAEGESLVGTHRGYDPSRYSANLDLEPNFRYSNLSNLGDDVDPTRFSTMSVMFDAKRISNLSTASSEESMSSDEFKHLPPHQIQHSFHSHHNSPLVRSREPSTEGGLVGPYGGFVDRALSPQPSVDAAFQSRHPNDKQELDDDYVASSPLLPAMTMPVPQPTGSYASDKQEILSSDEEDNDTYRPQTFGALPLNTLAEKRLPGAIPPRIVLSLPHGGQEMSMATDDQEAEVDHPPF